MWQDLTVNRDLDYWGEFHEELIKRFTRLLEYEQSKLTRLLDEYSETMSADTIPSPAFIRGVMRNNQTIQNAINEIQNNMDTLNIDQDLPWLDSIGYFGRDHERKI